MNTVVLLTLVAQALALAALVLALFRLRAWIGLVPLYVTLGVFQPVQAMLTSAVYVEVAPGWPVSPGTLMFATTLLAMLVVYIREDGVEARRVTAGVLLADLVMIGLLTLAAHELARPGALHLLPLAPQAFAQGARATFVGTLALFADVALLVALYGGGAARTRHPLLRAWLTMAGVLVLDAVLFTTGAFLGDPRYVGLLLGSIVSKLAVGSLFACVLVAYLRWIDTGVRARRGDARSPFYASTWRDLYEQQSHAHARELTEVFERITDAFLALDADGRYVYVNARAAHVLGQPADRLLGRRVWDVWNRDEHPQFAAALDGATRDHQPREFETAFPPDRWFENRIYPSSQGVTIYFRDVTERVRQREGLVRRATVHELTGLPNRHGVRERLDALLEGRAETAPLGVVVFNLDRLHHVNDTLGYAAGDAVVQDAARRLVRWAERRGWSVGALGGDEFVLIGEGHAPTVLPAIARDALETLAAPFAPGGQSVHLTACTGVSWFPDAGRDAAALLEQADLALNLAKQRGRGQLGVFSAARAADVRDRVRLVSRLREALASDGFALHYQPIVDADGRIVAAEALLRWNDAELGTVAPSRFVHVAEDTGAIVRLGDWALRRALADMRAWSDAGLATVPVSVNVSAVQLQRAEFVHEVADALREARVPGRLLKLELTESALMGEDDGAALLSALKVLGLGLSLDDFGTGWSSLARLRRYPIDELKIDRAFVEDIGRSGAGEALCRTIIAMGASLRYRVVAEGVETEAQARFLADAGCAVLQGFFYARPVAADAFAALLLTGRCEVGRAVPA